MDFRFDPDLQCWSLFRYADVQAAFQDRRFAISPSPIDEAGHSWALRNAMKELSAERVAQWKLDLEQIPLRIGTDLVRDAAEPWCHAAALRLIGLRHDPGTLDLTRAAFAAGCDPLDSGLRALGDAAAVELSRILPMTLGPVTVQAFIAVSQTLTAFLAASWLALLEHPEQLEMCRTKAVPQARAIEELLRFAGPSQVQFRFASGEIDGTVSKGAKVALRTGEANRDTAQFGNDAGELNLQRNASGHLAFGLGPHACIGATLVRAALSIALPRFLSQSAGLCVLAVRWPGQMRRLAITAPQSILVT